MTIPTITYFTSTGELANMPDHPVEMVEIPYEQWAAHDGTPYAEYIPLDQVTDAAREQKVEAAKGQLLNRFTLRAKFERANRATYAFAIQPDHRGVESVFAVGRLA